MNTGWHENQTYHAPLTSAMESQNSVCVCLFSFHFVISVLSHLLLFAFEDVSNSDVRNIKLKSSRLSKRASQKGQVSGKALFLSMGTCD